MDRPRRRLDMSENFAKVAAELGDDMDAAQDLLKKIAEAYEFDEGKQDTALKPGSVVLLTGLVKCAPPAVRIACRNLLVEKHTLPVHTGRQSTTASRPLSMATAK